MDEIVAELNRAWRQRGTPSMRDLADRCGISHATVHNLLRGRNKWSSWHTISQVGRALGADLGLLERRWVTLRKAAADRHTAARVKPAVPLLVRVRVVGVAHFPEVDWPAGWPPPAKGDAVWGKDHPPLHVRSVSWYPAGDGEALDARPFVYVVVGPCRTG